jgi:hypothetical protein
MVPIADPKTLISRPGAAGTRDARRDGRMADRRIASRENACIVDGINARLDEAARNGRPLDVIFAVRGRVFPVAGKHRGRWRMRTGDGHVLTFRPEFVVAFKGAAEASDGRSQSAASRR